MSFQINLLEHVSFVCFKDAILRLNIGGTSYRIRTSSILKHGARTLLGRFARVDPSLKKQWADYYFEKTDEYFFERVPR